MNRLTAKIALITGAGQGIGAGIGVAFLAEGARVWFTDAVPVTDPAITGHPNARTALLDVTDEDAWDAIMRELIAAEGRIDILVNNAGINSVGDNTTRHDPEHCTITEWRRVHAVNLDGTFLGCRAAIRAMRPQGTGSIINMSSRSGLVGVPGAAAYASSKAAVRNHSKSVALWCAQSGTAIRCNSIHPAAIMTAMWEEMIGDGPDHDAKLRAMETATPLRRFGTVAEVAAIAVLLASDEATFITGSEYDIDGGLLAGSAASPE